MAEKNIKHELQIDGAKYSIARYEIDQDFDCVVHTSLRETEKISQAMKAKKFVDIAFYDDDEKIIEGKAVYRQKHIESDVRSSYGMVMMIIVDYEVL